MKVAVIIPVRNGVKDTLECLESLKQAVKPEHRVIVIDNGSTDNTAEAIITKFPEVILLSNPSNQSYSRSINQGAKLAWKFGAEAIMALNNDTIVSKNFLDDLIRTLEMHDEIGIVSPQILYYSDPSKVWYAGGRVLLPLGVVNHQGINKPIQLNSGVSICDFGTGCCMLVGKECFEDAGGFCEDYFFYGEDVDFCLRAREEDWYSACVFESRISHKVSASSTTWQKFKMKLVGELRLLQRHNSMIVFPFAFVGFVVYNSFRLIIKLFRAK